MCFVIGNRLTPFPSKPRPLLARFRELFCAPALLTVLQTDGIMQLQQAWVYFDDAIHFWVVCCWLSSSSSSSSSKFIYAWGVGGGGGSKSNTEALKEMRGWGRGRGT